MLQVLPSIQLSPFIKHYLFLETSTPCIRKLRLFSDGNTAMVFSNKKNLVLNLEGVPTLLPLSFLYGQIGSCKDMCINGETSLVIVVFQPTGINDLLQLPGNTIKDQIISIDNILGIAGSILEEQLWTSDAVLGKTFILNNFFSALAANTIFNQYSFVSPTVKFIIQHKGVIAMQHLERFTGYTERHIERKFNEAIGISPKYFINLVKLHCFIKQLNNNQSPGHLTQLAYDAGYSDQSHLVKEFKKYTGMTPTFYKKKTGKLAINLVTLIETN